MRRLPEDAIAIKNLIEKCFKCRCKTRRTASQYRGDQWNEFNYFINQKLAMRFKSRYYYGNTYNREVLTVKSCVYHNNDEFYKSILLLFPEIIIVRCV